MTRQKLSMRLSPKKNESPTPFWTIGACPWSCHEVAIAGRAPQKGGLIRLSLPIKTSKAPLNTFIIVIISNIVIVPPGHATILVTRGVFRMWNSVLEEVYLRIFSVTFLQIHVHCGHNNFSANNSSGRATPPVLRSVRGHEPKTSPK